MKKLNNETFADVLREVRDMPEVSIGPVLDNDAAEFARIDAFQDICKSLEQVARLDLFRGKSLLGPIVIALLTGIYVGAETTERASSLAAQTEFA